jgi:GH25 family lysozyme M1 (1,4-beta-N-acetylmuramidase)
MTDSLIVDAYEGDGRKDWAALAAAGDPWRGAILKATQGTYYSGGTWFSGQWRLVDLAGRHANRQASHWIRGAYHYLDLRQDAVAQADHFLAVLTRAGGARPFDVLAVDVERAGQRENISGAQVVDRVSAFARRVKDRTGKWLLLYGGSYLAELGIVDRMGCKYLWTARYTETLPAVTYTRIGWDLASLAMWQYAGVAGNGHVEAKLKGYPTTAPGCGAIDISAVVLPGGTDALVLP